MVSPGFAGREGVDGIEAIGSTNVEPSGRNAAAYWRPPMRNPAGASNPGCVALTVIRNCALGPAEVETVTTCGPVPTDVGTCAFTGADRRGHLCIHLSRADERNEGRLSSDKYTSPIQ